MRLDRNTRISLRLQQSVFVLLVLGLALLLALLGERYHAEMDWTAGERNTLSEDSRRLLEQLEGPISVTVFARSPQLRQQAESVIRRYTRVAGERFTSEIVNPDLAPERARSAGVRTDGQAVVGFRERTETIDQVTEYALSNALQRLARERWVVFLTGHGERAPYGSGQQSGQDLTGMVRELSRKGFNVQELSLVEERRIPDNTSLVVIASPRRDYLPQELAALEDYLDGGGNLLWLLEPGEGYRGLDTLARRLGLELRSGTLVDPRGYVAAQDPTLVLTQSYASEHPVSRRFDFTTVFPAAGALTADAPDAFEVTALISSEPEAWLEQGPLEGELSDDEEDPDGPMDIALAFTRTLAAEQESETGDPADDAPPEQRIVAVADADFLSDAYLGNGGNLDLGVNLFTWLSQDDRFLDIVLRSAPDTQLDLSETEQYVIGAGFLFLLPGLLLGGGIFVWLRRRRA